MVENNLEFDELRRLLRPVLQLKSMQTILGELGSPLGIQSQDEEEATAQTKLKLMYKGFEAGGRVGGWPGPVDVPRTCLQVRALGHPQSH